jgi:hypothetical protein
MLAYKPRFVAIAAGIPDGTLSVKRARGLRWEMGWGLGGEYAHMGPVPSRRFCAPATVTR